MWKVRLTCLLEAEGSDSALFVEGRESGSFIEGGSIIGSAKYRGRRLWSPTKKYARMAVTGPHAGRAEEKGSPQERPLWFAGACSRVPAAGFLRRLPGAQQGDGSARKHGLYLVVLAGGNEEGRTALELRLETGRRCSTPT